MMLGVTAIVILCTTTLVAGNPVNMVANEKSTTLSENSGIININAFSMRGKKFVIKHTTQNISDNSGLTTAPDETILSAVKFATRTYYWTTLYCLYSYNIYVATITIQAGHHSLFAALACNDYESGEVDIHTATSAFPTCGGTYTNLYYVKYSNAIVLYYAY